MTPKESLTPTYTNASPIRHPAHTWQSTVQPVGSSQSRRSPAASPSRSCGQSRRPIAHRTLQPASGQVFCVSVRFFQICRPLQRATAKGRIDIPADPALCLFAWLFHEPNPRLPETATVCGCFSLLMSPCYRWAVSGSFCSPSQAKSETVPVVCSDPSERADVGARLDLGQA
jgi:hypothetical protein